MQMQYMTLADDPPPPPIQKEYMLLADLMGQGGGDSPVYQSTL